MRCPRCRKGMQLMNADAVLGTALITFYCADCNHNAADGSILKAHYEILPEKPFFAVSQIEENGIGA